MDLPGVPNRLLEELREAAISVGVHRLALVGGAVRDQLLHQRFGRALAGRASEHGADAAALNRFSSQPSIA